MSSFVIILVLCSAVMHAAFNLLARGQRSERLFFGQILLICAIIGFIPAVGSEIMVRSFPPMAWVCLAGSGICGSIHFFFLGKAYETSDFTIVYPIARAVPVLLIAFADVLRGRDISAGAWIGMILVTAGCFLSPLHSFGEFNWRRYLKRSRIWMLFAGLMTVCYTMTDKYASEVVAAGPATAARYAYFFFAFICVFYLILLKLAKMPKLGSVKFGWKKMTAATICNYGAYAPVIWAYQLSSHASYIAAFRQVGIVIGVVTAFVIYKERGLAVRITASVMITGGLILISVSG